MSSITEEEHSETPLTASGTPVNVSTIQRFNDSTFQVIMDRVLFGALLLVVASSPFEAGYRPMGRFFMATFTNLEVMLLILAAVWMLKMLVDPAARSRLLRLPLLWPALALVAASLTSMYFGEYQSLGVQFTYRLLMGAVVMTSVWEVLRSTGRLLVTLFALVGVAFVSALLGLLEYAPWFDIEPMIAAFKPMPTTVGGALRLSGSFEYANGAAMYFEMVLPVTLGLAVLFSSKRLVNSISSHRYPPSAVVPSQAQDSRRSEIVGPKSETGKRLLQTVLFLLCGVFAMALLLTLSRAALLATSVTLIVFAAAALVRGRSQESKFIRPVIFGSLGLATLAALLGVGYVFATQPVFRLRLTTENDRNWYNVTYQPGEIPELAAGDIVTVPVTIRNDGPMVWQANGALPVHVSYHWLSEDQKTALVFEGARSHLPHDLQPGEVVTVKATLMTPPKAGVYFLQWDLVQERVIWFSYKTGHASELTRHVVGAPSTAQTSTKPKAPITSMPPPVEVRTAPDVDTVERSKLWASAFKMFMAHPITGVGPDGFRNLRGKYEGVTNWNKNIFTNNTYIEMFTNLGVLGGLAFLWLGGLALWLAFRGILRGPVDARWAIGLGATAAVTAFFFHGFLDYFLFSTPLYVIFWLLMGVAIVQSPKSKVQSPKFKA